MDFVDLHLHLLPAVDDGCRTMEDTLAMARALVSLGFSQAAPSPHNRPEYAPREVTDVRLSEVRAALAEAGVALALHTNAESYFQDEHLMDQVAKGTARTLGTGKVLLVEAPYTAPLPMLSDLIFRMKLKGVTPLIAHPERCLEFEKKGRAADVVQGGALLQLDIGALIGRYGKTAQKLSRAFVEQGLYAVAATDLHSPVGAEDWVGRSLEALKKAAGAEGLASMLRDRPARLLTGDAS